MPFVDLKGVLSDNFLNNKKNRSNNCRDASSFELRTRLASEDAPESFQELSSPTSGSTGVFDFPNNESTVFEDGGQLVRTKSLVGTMEYMAPEIICMFGKRTTHTDGYSAAVDWWALGVMIYHMATGSFPLARVPLPSLLMQAQGPYNDTFYELFGSPDYDLEGLTPEIVEVIKGLLLFEPEQRWSSDQLMDSAMFQGLDWNLLEAKELPPPYLPVVELLPDMDETQAISSENRFHSSLADFLTFIKQPEWIDNFHDTPFEAPSNTIMATLLRLASGSRSGSGSGSKYGAGKYKVAPDSDSEVTQRRSHSRVAPSSQSDTPPPQVEASKRPALSDQGYFFGWSYVNPKLVELKNFSLSSNINMVSYPPNGGSSSYGITGTGNLGTNSGSFTGGFIRGTSYQ